MKTVQQALEGFYDWLGVDGTTPAGTFQAYRADLAQFVAFLSTRGAADARALCAADMHAFADSLHERGYAAATIARRIVTLRAFNAFLLQEGILVADPCADLHPPAVARRLRTALTVAQIDALRALMLRDGTPCGWRDRAILEVLLATALRASDLVALDVGDVDMDAATVAVRERRGTTRTLALHPAAVMALAAYLQLGRPRLLRAQRNSGALFLNQQGERLTRQGCWVVLKAYARAIEVDDLSAEVIRQSVAVLRLADGASLDEVQALLGHAARKTTAVYQSPAELGAASSPHPAK
jgi:integrase/recombinase XerD